MEQVKRHDQLTMYIHPTESKMLIFTYMYTLFGGVYTTLETEKTYRRSNGAVRVFMLLKKQNVLTIISNALYLTANQLDLLTEYVVYC